LFGREKRLGNNLYQELSFQDTDALGDVDEGADLTGKILKYFRYHFFFVNDVEVVLEYLFFNRVIVGIVFRILNDCFDTDPDQRIPTTELQIRIRTLLFYSAAC
jgi:hypothetical protein